MRYMYLGVEENFEISQINIKRFRHLLVEELSSRCQKNSSYSLRAFSRDLKLNHSTLSKILAEKQSPSSKTVRKVLESAVFPSDQLESLFAKDSSLDSKAPCPDRIPISEYDLVSNWRYWAFMELIHLDQFRYELDWIANSLGISKFEVQSMIQRLENNGLILIQEDTIIDNTNGFTSDIGSPVAPAYFAKKQKDLLAKAIECIDQIDIKKRSNSSVIFSCDSNFIAQAKEHIKDFRRKMANLAKKSKNQTKVYSLSISLFPLSNDQEEGDFFKGEENEV